MRYNDALEIGLLPDQFWGMSLREVKDTVYSRFKQRQRDIYALSARVRVAVLSCFSKETTFPPPPSFDDETEGDWRDSYNYMSALSEVHKGGAIK